MEESINSSMDSTFFSKVGSASSEESGWTIYFEDFMATAAEKAGGVFSSGAVSESSVVSDAASSVAWKLSASFEVTEDYRELSLKKTKGKRLVDDDSLEDTASSPVSSPKARRMTTGTQLSLTRVFCLCNSQENVVRDRNCHELEETVTGSEFIERTKGCTELKKREPCLVPLSMSNKYLLLYSKMKDTSRQ
ncbi:hypothetical protein C4D60_Mb09t21290 [Musa balbisiana]|uniref:Uncharacterized protein n=1 Tax=Musa balbisiana TaxID=52838 RepID=A0A4S8II40_MUSBA|nr:hypothetical protein C4D60_Mb09t21290 [Musa balbisiana]